MLRLKELRLERDITLRDMAIQLNISYSSLGKYEREEQQPSLETLVKLADFFDVSIDYLLGTTNIKTKNLEISYMADYLGLTELSIHELHRSYTLLKEQGDNRLKQQFSLLNRLLFPSNELLSHISDYLNFTATHFKNFYDKSSMSPISELELWDDIDKVSYSDDWDLWSKALLLIIEEELTFLRRCYQAEKVKEESHDDK